MTSPTKVIDPALAAFVSTPRQAEYLDAINETGGLRAAARKLGISHSAIEQFVRNLRIKAARKGRAEGSPLEFNVPDPFVVKGYSSLWNHEKQEYTQTWIKTREDHELTREAVEAFVRSCMGTVPLAPLVPPPAHKNDDLMSVYGFGDPHFGMYAWARESGDSFDLAEANRLTRAAIDRLVHSSPASSSALIINIGDAFHADNDKNQTPSSGHALDVAGRLGEIFEVTCNAFIYCVMRALEKHEHVTVWNMIGNHDPTLAVALSFAMYHHFLGNPRVKVCIETSLYKYHRFGRVLIGAHHGHGAKASDLPLLMATDRKEDWGMTDHRYFLCGHIHHKTKDKEHPGCFVETLRTLAPRDGWHAGKGYRAGRDAQVIVYHKEYGEMVRHRADVALLVEGVSPCP